MKFFFRTLGCKMNWLDSARISAGLQNAGHLLAASEQEADTIFVNSCIVTGKAERESRHEAARFGKLGKKIVIFGCGPKTDQNKWNEKYENALVFGKESELLHHFGIPKEDISFPDVSRTRLPIAIQAGCDNFCTFCITRIARGKHENLPLEGIVRQIHRAEAAGVQEIVLTGINLAAWGCSNSNKSEESKFGELLHEILKQTTIPRIRLSSLGPQFLHDDFFEAMKNPRMCDHLHLSIQSGSESVLQRMNRGHGIKEVYTIVEKMRKIRPDCSFTADFIVGFPGETDVEFKETIEMVEKIGFYKLHVFPFSAREGTSAANFPNQILMEIQKKRAQKLRELSEELQKKFLISQLGKVMNVLIEKDGTGLTANYIRLKLKKLHGEQFRTMKISEENIVPV